MLYLLPHQSSPPIVLVSLNRRLEDAVKAPHSPNSQALLASIADYLHCCSRQHEDQIKPWKGAFLSLAREINIEMSKLVNQDLQRRVAPRYDGIYEYRREWHWADFARDEFGLEPVQPAVESEVIQGTPTPSHNGGAPLLSYSDDSTRTLTD
jgi:hypothetical protein